MAFFPQQNQDWELNYFINSFLLFFYVSLCLFVLFLFIIVFILSFLYLFLKLKYLNELD